MSATIVSRSLGSAKQRTGSLYLRIPANPITVPAGNRSRFLRQSDHDSRLNPITDFGAQRRWFFHCRGSNESPGTDVRSEA